MKYGYLFFTIITLAAFVSCNKCDECDNLYYEPVIKIVFLDSGGKDTDSIKATILSFLGHTDLLTQKGDSSLIMKKRANYNFPLRLDSNQTTYSISYIEFPSRKGSIGKTRTRKFKVNYHLLPYFYNDRKLFYAIMDSISGSDSVILSCTGCTNTQAQIKIYE